jgi:hypothetical protein
MTTKTKWVQAWRIVNDIDYAMRKIRRKGYTQRAIKRHDQLQKLKERIKYKYLV